MSAGAGWQDRSIRRPAVAAAIALIAGILCHSLLPHVVWIWIAVACAFAIAGIALRYHNNAVVAVAIAFTGVVAGQLSAFYFAPDDIGSYATDQPRLARLELELNEPLRILTGQFNDGRRPMPPRQVTTASVVRVLTKTGWTEASGQILVQIDPPNQNLKLGQRIRVLGMLQRPSPAMNPGQFDWAAYYRQQRILTSIQLSHGGAIEILESKPPSLLARLREGVRAALAKGFSSERSLDHALLRALVLGDNDPELRDIQEQFRRTGTSHHLAISGMHIAVLGWFVLEICKRLLMQPRAVAWVLLIFIALYGAVALPSPPATRSVILCIAVGFGFILGRSIDFIHLLAISAIALLVCHPLDLYSAGFQLSFGTVLGLIVLTRRIEPFFTRDPDAEVALNTVGGNPPFRLWLIYRGRQLFGPWLAAGITAWVVSMPVIAYHFDQLNPWAVLTSLALAVPVFLSLIAGFLKIVLTLLLPFGASWWAAGAAIPVAWMRHGVDWLARLPGSDWPLPAHSILFVIVYYSLLLLPLVPIPRPRIKLSLRLGPVMAVMLLVAIPITGGAARVRDGSLRVTALAIGAGQCCVIELPDGRVILLDAGSMTLQEPVRKCITPYLRSRGHATIDELWLADCDYDHIGAAAEIIRGYSVGKVVFSTAFERDAADKPAGEALFAAIRERNAKVIRLARGDQIEIGKGVTIEVLWPTTGEVRGPSNNSDLVLKLTYARRSILFPADVQQAGQAELLRWPSELHCDAMLAPHHGSGESTTAALIAAADPLYIISSNDRTLSQKQRLFERQIGKRELFRTNRSGATTITIDRNGGIMVTPFLSDDEVQ